MSVLVKNIINAVPPSPGTPTVPAVPATPYVPSVPYVPAVPARPELAPTPYHPGYWLTVVTQVPAYHVVCILRSAEGHTIGGFPPGTCLASARIPTGGTTPVTTQYWVAPQPAQAGIPAFAGTAEVPGVPEIPGTPFIPAILGSPPVPGTPANFNFGWNAGARGTNARTADCQYTFDTLPSGSHSIDTTSIPSGVQGVASGLTTQWRGPGYSGINFCFVIQNGTARVYELGIAKTSPTSVTDSSFFTIRRVGKEIAYFINNTCVYTSLVLSTGSLWVQSSLYSAGDMVVKRFWSNFPDAWCSAIQGQQGVTGILGGGVAKNKTAASMGYAIAFRGTAG